MIHHPLMPAFRGVLALLLFISTQAFAVDGVIQSSSGRVLVNGAPASEGTEVSSGDTLKADFGASMLVVMSDRSELDIRSNSEVRIVEYAYDPVYGDDNIQVVDVLDGTLRYASGAIANNDSSDVSVQAGGYAVAMLGTGFTLVYNAATGKFDLDVTEGSVQLSSSGNPIPGAPANGVVAAGEQASISVGEGSEVTFAVTNAQGVTETATYRVSRGSDGSLVMTFAGQTMTETPGGSQPQYSATAPTFNQAITNTDD